MLSLFEMRATLLGLTAVFAWLNEVTLRLPSNVALLLMGLGASLLLIALNALLPGTRLYEKVIAGLVQIDLYSALIQGILAFPLFAGAMHVDVTKLRSRAPIIAGLTTLGSRSDDSWNMYFGDHRRLRPHGGSGTLRDHDQPALGDGLCHLDYTD